MVTKTGNRNYKNKNIKLVVNFYVEMSKRTLFSLQIYLSAILKLKPSLRSCKCFFYDITYNSMIHSRDKYILVAVLASNVIEVLPNVFSSCKKIKIKLFFNSFLSQPVALQNGGSIVIDIMFQ